MKSSTLYSTALLPLLLSTTAGCLIDDSGNPRGQAGAPVATVPDTGGPTRRESAAKTLDDAGSGGSEEADLNADPLQPAR